MDADRALLKQTDRERCGAVTDRAAGRVQANHGTANEHPHGGASRPDQPRASRHETQACHARAQLAPLLQGFLKVHRFHMSCLSLPRIVWARHIHTGREIRARWRLAAVRYNRRQMAIRKNGYVALFDVLGFSERVMRGAVGEGLDAYVNTVVHISQHGKQLGTILFSDTVVLYTFEDSEDSFNDIIGASCQLFHDLLMADVPVRGAISYGEFLRSEDERHGTVIAGRPIIDAYFYESRQQWIGIMLTPSLLERRQEITNEFCSLGASDGAAIALATLMIQPCSSIPLESVSGQQTAFEGFAIVPLAGNEQTLRAIRDTLDGTRKKLERLKQLAPDARSQAKYQRSLEWLGGVRRNFMEALGDHIHDVA
jgi:hypothetical protein